MESRETEPAAPVPASASISAVPAGEPREGKDQPATSADVRGAPRRRWIHWLLEGMLIVVSVALGFGLTQWGERRHERELAERMLLGIRAEVEYNRATLDPYLPIHRAWRDAVGRRDPSIGMGSAMDVLFEARPPLRQEMTTNVPLFRRAAWDTALSTGALRLIDYDLAANISEIYNMQAYAASMFPPLFTELPLYDPAARVAALRLAQTTMKELTFAEESLLALYDRYLPAIRRATGER